MNCISYKLFFNNTQSTLNMILVIKKLIILSCILSVIGCNKNTEDKRVKLVILNSEIHTLKRVKSNLLAGYSESDKEKAKNYLKFKLVNNTDSIQILIFDPYIPLLKNLVPKVVDKSKVVKNYDEAIVELIGDADDIEHFHCLISIAKYENEKYEQFGIKDIDSYKGYQKNSITLNPGEERTFVSLIYLPIINNNLNNYDEVGFAFYENIEMGDLFSLKYNIDAKVYQNSLPDWERKELDRKGVKFYDKPIESNLVPIKIIN